MKLQNKISSALALVTVIGTLFLLAGPASAQFSPNENAFLATVQAVPTTTEDMSLYTRAEQKTLLRSMDPIARSTFWTGKLQDYLDAHPDLGNEQVELIEFVRTLATPELFASTDDEIFRPVVESMIEGLSTTALGLFDAKEFGTIFIGLGNEPTQCSSGGSEVPQRATKEFACNCRWGQGCGGCVSTICTITTNGCGFLGMERCTKYCLG